MSSQVEIIERHKIWIRITHWINFPVLSIMVWSGALIYWANRVYWPQLPDGFYSALGMEYRLGEGMAYHFAFMWPFVINGVIYVLLMAISGEWRALLPRWRDFRDAPKIVLHELGIKKMVMPEGELNPAQRIMYTGVMIMGAGATLTGVAIYKPVQLSWLKQIVGGYETARALHYAIALGFVLFFFVHVVQVARAGWNSFRSMVTGYEIRDEERNAS